MFNTDCYIWTTKDIVSIPAGFLGFHKYHQVAETAKTGYGEYRDDYEQRRGFSWTLKPKRADRLLEALKECDALLEQNEVVQVDWSSDLDLDVLLANGSLLRITLANDGLNIDRFFIDKSLVGKLSQSLIQTGCFGNNMILCSNEANPTIDVVTYAWNKRNSQGNLRKAEKLSAMSMKVSRANLPLSESQKCRKNFALNVRKDLVVVWWSFSVWTSAKTHNVLIYSVKNNKLEQISGLHTENPIHGLAFKKSASDEFVVIETINNGPEGRIITDISTFVIKNNELSNSGRHSVAFNEAVDFFDFHPSLNVLLAGLSSGALVRHDMDHNQTNEVNIRMKVNGVCWNTEGSVFFTWNRDGEIRFCDMVGQALSFVVCDAFTAAHKVEHNLVKYFRCTKSLSWTRWNQSVNPTSTYSHISLGYDKGPLSMLLLDCGQNASGLSLPAVMGHYCYSGMFSKAVNLLRALHWADQPAECYTCFSTLMNSLLVQPLLKDIISCVEESLASFYVSRQPIPKSIIIEYKDKLMSFTRRFFFLLLRNGYLEKAFLLAEDIGHADLFLDLRQQANASGDLVLGEVARLKAEACEHRSDDESSHGSQEDFGIPDDISQQLDARGDAFAMEDRLLKQFGKILALPTNQVAVTKFEGEDLNKPSPLHHV